MPQEFREGYLTSDGYSIYHREVGDGALGTILCVHGGPGMTHDYLLPLADLAKVGYRVVFYDALGCGHSELPQGVEHFTLEHDLKVLDDVRQQLCQGPVHLMGSSYGGLLVLKYATFHHKELRSVISTGGLSDVPFTIAEMNRLKQGLPQRVRDVLESHAASGDFGSAEYLEAVQFFYRRHLCRMNPWPAEMTYSLEHVSLPVYLTMNGPNEFTIVGNIKDIEFTAELSKITVPTLLVHGKYDEVTPRVGERIRDHLPGSRLVVLPRSSHVGFWEERPKYMALVRTFLQSVDQGRSSDLAPLHQ
jgi:proline iminopeptidase